MNFCLTDYHFDVVNNDWSGPFNVSSVKRSVTHAVARRDVARVLAALCKSTRILHS